MKKKHLLLAIPGGLLLFGFAKSVLTSTTGWLNQPILATLMENYGWIGVLIVLIGFGLGKGWVQGIGALLVLLAVFFSGAGHWTRTTAEHVSVVLSCEADPDQAKCTNLAQKQAAQEAREFAQKVQRAAAQAAAREAIEQARLAAIEAAKPKPTQVKLQVCGRKMAKDIEAAGAQNCRGAVFGKNQIYSFEGTPGTCPRFSPGDAGTQTRLAGIQHRFVPNHTGVLVHFYELKPGQTLHGFTCG